MSEWVNDIHEGDVIETLQEFPESSVHMAMCSPPYYGLRDYEVEGQIGLEESLDEYVENLVAVGEEIRRVLRDDGSWWLNLGDTYAGGSIVRSDANWTRPGDDGYEEAHTASTDSNGRRSMSTLGRKNKMLVPHRVAIALQDAGWVLRSDAVWMKPNPMPSSVTDRLNEQKEFLFHLAPNPDYWFDLDSIREEHVDSSLARSGRCDNAERGYPGTPQTMDPDQFVHPNGKNPGDVLEITVKSFPEAHFAVYPQELCETPIKASCPPEVCAECGQPYDRESEVVDREFAGGVSPVPEEERGYADRQGQSQNDREGLTQPTERTIGEWEQQCECETTETKPGIVLDPFAGAGTTLLVAKDLRRRFVGIDLNPDYVALAQRRVGIDVDEPERLHDDGQQVLVSGDGGWNGGDS